MTSYDRQLAHFCAPALAGIKTANLVSYCNKEYPDLDQYLSALNSRLNKTGIYFEKLCSCSKRSLIFVYRKRLLTEYLSQEECKAFLEALGYPIGNIDNMIAHLKNKVSNESEFPHEIGLFLGYPLSDIEGFLINRGLNYQLNGYWKVYSNVNQTAKKFEQYTRCRKSLCKHISNGKTIVDMFDLCSKAG